MCPAEFIFFSPAVLSVVFCYLGMCFSAAIGTCLIPGQVPRCKGSFSVYAVGLLLLLLLGFLQAICSACPFNCLTRAKDQLGLRNGTRRNTCLQEKRLEQHLFEAKA